MPRRRSSAGRRRKKYVQISVVAERFDVHPQTIRLYEREGLLRPARSAGNTRLYDERSIRRLETILNLTRELGVNLAGVEVILSMKQRMEEMEAEMERLTRLAEELALDLKAGIQRQHALVKVTSGPPSKTDALPSRRRGA